MSQPGTNDAAAEATMNFKTMLTLTMLFLASCAKTSSGTSDASASSVLTISPMSSTVALSGTTTVLVTGGTGTYVNAGALLGRLTQSSTSTYLYTAPASATISSDVVTISDSSGAVGSVAILVGGATTSTTSTGSPFTSTSCQGNYSMTIGGVAATLSVVQNTSNQISGDLIINSYHYPINGNCSLTVGSTSGTLSFVNLMMNQTYNANVILSSGVLALSGSVTAAGNVYTFTGSSSGVTAAPTAQTYQCDGLYTAMIGTNAGQIRLINNGSGTVAGYLLLQGYYYAFTGTCGPTVSLQNLTNGSNYTGTATFGGATVAMTGSFTTSAGATYSWSANK